MALAIPRIFWPLTLTSANNSVKFKAYTGDLEFVGTVAAATYYDPETLVTAVGTAILAATHAGNAFSSVTYNGTLSTSLSAAGVVTLTFGGISSGSHVILESNTDANTVFGLLGFSTAAPDTTQALSGTTATVVSPNQVQNFWTPELAPEFDSGGSSASEQQAAVAVVRTAGGQNRSTRFATLTDRTVRWKFLVASKMWIAAETSSTTYQAYERLWSSSGIGRFRYWTDRTVTGTYGDYFLLAPSAEKLTVSRYSPASAFFALELQMGAFVA